MGISTAYDFSSLSRIALFHDLTPPQLRQISEALHRKTFPANAPLMDVEQPGEVVYFILSGTVKVHVEQADGHDVIISILGPGECVGEMSLLDQIGRSASVVTIEESEMLWLDRATFRRCLLTMPMLAHNLACVLSARLRLANEQIQALAAHEAENRIARQILAFARRYGQQLPNGDLHVPIRLTQSDIASMVGASREHTNKILVSYKERGYLSVDQHHHITIHDQRALARRCH
ncbi:MAG: Crp/Fnr family transcriptional regulator [Acidobacteriota bacterium]|nr:Crp/Fnr family transcriptional regulator [Acidobacteriota bacterium]